MLAVPLSGGPCPATTLGAQLPIAPPARPRRLRRFFVGALLAAPLPLTPA